MKPTFTLNPSRVLYLLLFILLALPAHTATANNIAATTDSMRIALPGVGATSETKKTGLFKKVRMIRDLKKALKQQPVEGEKASRMARIALILFLSCFALSLIGGLAGVAVISLLSSLAFVGSVVLAFIVLFSEDNRKSRAIAKTILIIAGVMLVLSVVLILALISVLGG